MVRPWHVTSGWDALRPGRRLGPVCARRSASVDGHGSSQASPQAPSFPPPHARHPSDRSGSPPGCRLGAVDCTPHHDYRPRSFPANLLPLPRPLVTSSPACGSSSSPRNSVRESPTVPSTWSGEATTRPWEAQHSAGFQRRLGKRAAEVGDSRTTGDCPEIWELDNGDIAVNRSRRHRRLRRPCLPYGVTIGSDERLVVISGRMLSAVESDIRDA